MAAGEGQPHLLQQPPRRVVGALKVFDVPPLVHGVVARCVVGHDRLAELQGRRTRVRACVPTVGLSAVDFTV